MRCPRCKTGSCGAQVTARSQVVDEEPAAVDTFVERLQRLVPKEFAERLLATRGRIQADGRLVTIHCSDVKGSGAMAEESRYAPAGQWRWQHMKTNDQGRMCEPLCAPGLRLYRGFGGCPEQEVGLSGDGTACSGPSDESRET